MEYKNLGHEWIDEQTVKIVCDEDENMIEIPDWCYKAQCIITLSGDKTCVKWYNVKVCKNVVSFHLPIKLRKILSLTIDEFELHKLKISYTNSNLNKPVEPVIDDGLNEKINHLETEIKKLNSIIGFLKSEIKLIRDNCGL
jgi:hypothetical protein